MTTILAGLVGGLVGVVGVLLGAWLNARREDRKWLRDQQLRGAVEFLASAGQLYRHKRLPSVDFDAGQQNEKEWLDRMAIGRSHLHVLFSAEVISLSDTVSRRVFKASPTTGDDEHRETIKLLNSLTKKIRHDVESRKGWRRDSSN